MIPQTSPLANYLSNQAALDESIRRVLSAGRYILGDETAAFERQFADYIGVPYAVGVGNGTEALHLALRALGIGAGDEVITVSHTAVATVAAVEMSGATPVLVDIRPSSYTLDAGLVERAISKRSKAIVPVHLYGQPCEMEQITRLAKTHDLFVVEDCAQSHGALYQQRRTGAWGHAAAFSFYPTKNLGCLGDGGAIVTRDPTLYNQLTALRQYGWDEKRISQCAGWNSRIDELQAAVLRVKLVRLEESNRRRIQIARTYDRLLSGIPELTLPSVIPGTTHVYHQYVVRCADPSARNRLIAHLSEQGIQTAVHYPLPVHLHPAYAHRLPGSRALPVTEEVSPKIISLPLFPELTDEEVGRVATSITGFFGRRV
jgi:dTDP-4-amino-4,6-dideoxygalactose transaminase